MPRATWSATAIWGWLACTTAYSLLPSRLPQTPRLLPSSSVRMDGVTGGDADIGDTFFATWDGKTEDGLGPDGMIPPGNDLVERELKRIFNVDSSPNGTFTADEVDEVMLMFKLRREMGDEDFRKIFDDARVRGLDVF